MLLNNTPVKVYTTLRNQAQLKANWTVKVTKFTKCVTEIYSSQVLLINEYLSEQVLQRID